MAINKENAINFDAHAMAIRIVFKISQIGGFMFNIPTSNKKNLLYLQLWNLYK